MDAKVHRAGSARFALQTLPGGKVIPELFREEFKGNVAPKTRAFRLVDETHTAAAQLLEDAVMRD